MPITREKSDRCPGAFRPWQAADGMLVRLRLIGGRVSSNALTSLLDAAEEFGDGRIFVTSRANLQVRGFPGRLGRLDDAALAALERTGLLPSRTHELVRNVMLSPQSGLAGGRADLRELAGDLDRRLCADRDLAGLSGRFLFVMDDGRGDLLERPGDLGLVALTADLGQLRVGSQWAEIIPLSSAARRLVGLAATFARTRGSGPSAPWHVDELPDPLVPPRRADPRLPDPAAPLPYGEVRGGRHVAVPAAGLGRSDVAALATATDELIITPWRGILIPRNTHD